MPLEDGPGSPPRAIRSFVLRSGRLTRAQQRALDELLPRFGADAGALAELPELFGRRAPVYLEIGIGNGENIVAAARREPAWNFLGCDVHRPGLGHALLGVARESLDNVRLIEADVSDVVAGLGAGSLDGAAMYFPDPWPKKRHHKRRLLSSAFLARLAPVMKPSACFQFATDDADYAAHALALLAHAPAWLNLAGAHAAAPRPHARVVTRFEARARAAGRTVHELLAAPQATC